MDNLKEHCIIITGNKEIRNRIMNIVWDKYYYIERKKEYEKHKMMEIKKKVMEHEKQTKVNIL